MRREIQFKVRRRLHLVWFGCDLLQFLFGDDGHCEVFLGVSFDDFADSDLRVSLDLPLFTFFGLFCSNQRKAQA